MKKYYSLQLITLNQKNIFHDPYLIYTCVLRNAYLFFTPYLRSLYKLNIYEMKAIEKD